MSSSPIHAPSGETNPVPAFRRKSALALSVILCVSIVSTLTFELALAGGMNGGAVVNRSGRQRMLARTLARDATLAIALGDFGGESGAARSELQEKIAEFASWHRALVERDASKGLGGRNSPRIEAIFTRLEPTFLALTAKLEAISERNDGRSGLGEDWLSGILTLESVYVQGMEQATDEFEREYGDRLRVFRILHLGAFLTTLIALMALNFALFRPYGFSLDRYFRGLGRAMDVLRDQAAMDPLTGLYNRRGGLSILERELERARRDGGDLALIFADLDNLKRVNDEFGHESGDAYIREFAEGVKASIRAEDSAFRHGGDEFAIVAPGGRKAAEKIVSRLEGVLAQSSKAGGAAVEFSRGVSWISENPSWDAEALISAADGRMYEHKRRRKAARR